MVILMMLKRHVITVNKDWLSPARPLSIAHRGASAYAPENTLEAFEVAASLGADMWEVDLHLTADGQIIAFHHDRLADGRMLEDLSYSDIRSTVASDRVPLFSDVITLAQTHNIGIYADIKVNDAAVPTSNMLVAYGVKRAIISSRDPMMIGALASADCPYPRAIHVPPDTDPFDYAKGADIIHLCWERMACPQDLLDDVFFSRSAVLCQKIVLWHEEDPWRMTELRKKPVLGICSNRPELVKPFFVSSDWPVQVVCHRGANKVAPENSLPAMHAAFAAGFSHVELDVNVSSDGQLVVIHDATLERTTNGTGRVSDYPLETLRQLDVGGWFSPHFSGEQIPTLEESLDLAKAYRGKLYIEIKNAPVANIWNAVMATGMENDCFFWSFTTSSLHELRILSPEPRIMARRQDFDSLEDVMNFLEPTIVEFALGDNWSEIELLRTSDIASMIAYNGSDWDVFSRINQARPDMVNLDQPFLFSNFITNSGDE